ncbi:MAG: molecular chaperone HtpG [Steroidobacteraceae bacterium]
MSEAAAPQTMAFQAEVQQLLKLMIHSLYSHREIFLRELISNASDANDKLRFAALAEPALQDSGAELGIWIDVDATAGTLTVRDNGIGMSREDAIANLGTIARSGTAEFFRQMSGDAQKDSQLIGQFGVGFYSAFIVAERVEVLTRKAGEPASAGVHWSSTADGSFTVDTRDLAAHGTTVILHLKSDAREFADPFRIRALVRRYSDHISFPVWCRKEGEASTDYETVNQAKALWTRQRTEISDDEYREFYQHIAHDFTPPLAWSHNRVEGKREYTSLLYLPAQPPFDLYQRDAAHGLKLYVRRVFIMDDAEQFLPLYLRFVKGVVDSSDLPLNVSRELLQEDGEVGAIRSALTRRALDMIAKLSADDAAGYATFWRAFGPVLKEGLAEDPGNRDKILPLLRFVSTASEGTTPEVTLKRYVERAGSAQQNIYYLIADSIEAARTSPYLERLKAKNIEVLLLGDRIDAWVMGQLSEFDGKKFKDVARGDLESSGLADAADSARIDELKKESKPLLKRLKDSLGERIAEARVSARLAHSPACLVVGENDLGTQLARMLKAAGQSAPESKPVLEVNVEHPLIRHLQGLADNAQFEELALVIFDQAKLAESGQLGNPGEYLQRLNSLLARLVR